MMSRVLVMLAVAFLAACSDAPNPENSGTTAAGFDPNWIPKANGRGNLLVCLRAAVEKDELESVRMPARLVFQSWGQLQGPLRSDRPFDPMAVMPGPQAAALSSYAVVTVEPFTVSQAEPCVRVAARSVRHKTMEWKHDVVPNSIHYAFQVENFDVSPTFEMRGELSLPEDNPAKQVLLGGALTATPMKDIGDPIELSWSDG